MCGLVFAQAPVSVLLTQEKGKEIIRGALFFTQEITEHIRKIWVRQHSEHAQSTWVR